MTSRERPPGGSPIAPLMKDVEISLELVSRDGSPYNRRMLARNLFAAVEAGIYMVKAIALEAASEKPKRFTNAEQSLLLEETASLHKDGEPMIQPRFLPTAANLRFAGTALQKVCKRYPILPVEEPGWRAFQASLAVRHRITHPKARAALDISDRELTAIRSAAMWFREWVIGVLRIRSELLHLALARTNSRLQTLESKRGTSNGV